MYVHGYIYVTGKMDPSGEFVPAGPNLTGGMEPGMNKNNFRPNIWKANKFVFLKKHSISLQFFKDTL